DSMAAVRLEIDEALSDPVTFRPRSQLPVDRPRPMSSGAPTALGVCAAAVSSTPPLSTPQLPASTPAPQPGAASALRRSPPWLFAWFVALIVWLAIARPWQT